MNASELRLLNEYQRGFPLVSRPFALLARELGATEEAVLLQLERLQREGAVSRVGAVFRPGAIGASTLAAISLPAHRLSAAADCVSAHAEVNHNYEREHALNLWFVVVAADLRRLDSMLDDIERGCGARVLAMPLLEEYHIDLGFDFAGSTGRIGGDVPGPDTPARMDARDRALVAALEQGLEFTGRPFAALAARCAWSEFEVIGRLKEWTDEGLIRRFGVIVRHRELGYGANAMAVWDVPDERAAQYGRRLAGERGVTLCYRRERHLPEWRYNLYCMLHGKLRGEVSARVSEIAEETGLAEFPGEVLFSRRRFKQTGARYFSGAEAVRGAA